MSGGGNKVVKGRMGFFIVFDVNFNQFKVMEKILEKEIKVVEVNNFFFLSSNFKSLIFNEM